VSQNLTEQPTAATVDLKTLASLLVKHFGYHEGHYEVAIQLGIAVGPVMLVPPGAPQPTQFPGAIFGVTGIGLQRGTSQSPNSVDAAEVNPAVET
jgi:hypothetical protein